MTIEILRADLQSQAVGDIWAITIEITDGVDTYILAVTEPGTTLQGDLQSALNAKEVALWTVARIKGTPPDLSFAGLNQIDVNKAILGVILDEINILRVAAGLSPRTTAQLRGAIKSKLMAG